MNRCSKKACSMICSAVEVGSQSLQQRLALRGSRLLLRGTAMTFGAKTGSPSDSFSDFIWFHMISYDFMIWIKKKSFEFINIYIYINIISISISYQYQYHWIQYIKVLSIWYLQELELRWMTWCSSTSSMVNLWVHTWPIRIPCDEITVEMWGWNSNSPEGVASDSGSGTVHCVIFTSCHSSIVAMVRNGADWCGKEQWATPIYRGSDDD